MKSQCPSKELVHALGPAARNNGAARLPRAGDNLLFLFFFYFFFLLFVTSAALALCAEGNVRGRGGGDYSGACSEIEESTFLTKSGSHCAQRAAHERLSAPLSRSQHTA